MTKDERPCYVVGAEYRGSSPSRLGGHGETSRAGWWLGDSRGQGWMWGVSCQAGDELPSKPLAAKIYHQRGRCRSWFKGS